MPLPSSFQLSSTPKTVTIKDDVQTFSLPVLHGITEAEKKYIEEQEKKAKLPPWEKELVLFAKSLAEKNGNDVLKTVNALKKHFEGVNGIPQELPEVYDDLITVDENLRKAYEALEEYRKKRNRFDVASTVSTLIVNRVQAEGWDASQWKLDEALDPLVLSPPLRNKLNLFYYYELNGRTSEFIKDGFLLTPDELQKIRNEEKEKKLESKGFQPLSEGDVKKS